MASQEPEKKDGNRLKKVHGNDSFQRMNYLYQISKHIADKNPVLSAYYGNLITSVAKKNVLKIHPDIKRQFCKKCKCIAIHKVTATMRVKRKNKSKTIQWTCDICGTKRQFPANKNQDHRLWLERSEAVLEVIN
ncbi:hypothetical protein HW555_006394 [Spodoptera exigua]|uniref:Uncharacterized protein n=1 Tax=Spodoptera exigua TaxID=7107 RepID=A0A835L3K2_SPOEX|nr:hypothetical protein HW555_006394 [Spodoptera exigua]